MADLQTYAELKDAVATWLVREDLAATIPTFISSAERRFNRVLRAPEMEAVVTTSVTLPTVTLPADFLEMKSLTINASYHTVLEQAGIDQLRGWYSDTDTGEPCHFALQAADELVLGPAPDRAYDLVMNYYQKVPALSDSAPTNWLLIEHPDLYLAAALVEGFTMTLDAEAMLLWSGKVEQKLNEIKKAGIRKALSASAGVIQGGW